MLIRYSDYKKNKLSESIHEVKSHEEAVDVILEMMKIELTESIKLPINLFENKNVIFNEKFNLIAKKDFEHHRDVIESFIVYAKHNLLPAALMEAEQGENVGLDADKIDQHVSQMVNDLGDEIEKVISQNRDISGEESPEYDSEEDANKSAVDIGRMEEPPPSSGGMPAGGGGSIPVPPPSSGGMPAGGGGSMPVPPPSAGGMPAGGGSMPATDDDFSVKEKPEYNWKNPRGGWLSGLRRVGSHAISPITNYLKKFGPAWKGTQNENQIFEEVEGIFLENIEMVKDVIIKFKKELRTYLRNVIAGKSPEAAIADTDVAASTTTAPEIEDEELPAGTAAIDPDGLDGIGDEIDDEISGGKEVGKALPDEAGIGMDDPDEEESEEESEGMPEYTKSWKNELADLIRVMDYFEINPQLNPDSEKYEFHSGLKRGKPVSGNKRSKGNPLGFSAGLKSIIKKGVNKIPKLKRDEELQELMSQSYGQFKKHAIPVIAEKLGVSNKRFQNDAEWISNDLKEKLGLDNPIKRDEPTVSDIETPEESPVSDIESPVSDIESPVSDIESPVSDIEAPVSDIEAPVSDIEAPVSDIEAPEESPEDSVDVYDSLVKRLKDEGHDEISKNLEKAKTEYPDFYKGVLEDIKKYGMDTVYKTYKNYKKSAVDEPVSDEPAVDEPVSDEPAVDEPAVDEPAVDEPAVDEPAVDEPVSDEPVSDEKAPSKYSSLEDRLKKIKSRKEKEDGEPGKS